MSRIIKFKSSRTGEGSYTAGPHAQTCTETRFAEGTNLVLSDLCPTPPLETPKVWGRTPFLNLDFKFKFRFGERTLSLSRYPPTQEERREGKEESSASANGTASGRLTQGPGLLSPFVEGVPMNPDTLHRIQVGAFVTIALALVALDVLLLVAMLELAEFLPELLEAITELRRAL